MVPTLKLLAAADAAEVVVLLVVVLSLLGNVIVLVHSDMALFSVMLYNKVECLFCIQMEVVSN